MDDLNLIEKAKAYVEELFHSDFGGHGADHTYRVYENAMLLADKEPECDRETVALAALLHDADDHKLFNTENNANARHFLIENGITEEKTDEICSTINMVSFSRNRGRRPDTIEGKIVQDADRLDALGAIGIARTFAFGGERGRPLDDSIQHFYDKLLLLKDEMNTEAGRELAEKRHAFLIGFLEEYKSETGEQ
ncbi:MAG: HD domain-containing protein [Oscillospiraceae bacterium]|nr:HD domain-containing protein [Oscillospiraceae bacterium]